MNILVTGGAGFIGSHLIAHLLEQPDVQHIRVLDNLSTGKLHNLKAFHDKIEFLEADILDEQARARAVKDIDIIFHQAAIPSVPRSVDDPLGSHRNGVHATAELLESARIATVKRFIFAASSSAYGDTQELPKHENMPPNPLSPYAATKVACEQYLRAYARCYAMDTVSLRYFNVFGPRQDPNSPYSGVIARFCLASLGTGKITIFGDGEQSRDFTHVGNVVAANLLAARSERRLGGEVINLGAGRRTTLNQLVQILQKLSGKSLEVTYQDARKGDVRHSLASIDKAKTLLEYQPLVNLEDGLKQTLQWYAEGVE